MSVTEVVAAVATLGKEFQDQQETIDAMNSLLGVLCDDELKKHITETGIRAFVSGQSGTYVRASLVEKPRESDADSLPKSGK